MPGLYIHIPFCKQACHYCDFHFSTSLKTKEELVKALNREIELQKNFFEAGEEIPTIYFGGGTPSLLTTAEIDGIIRTIRDQFKVAAEAEITLEANPEDLSPEKLEELKDSGINRLSIGIQSFSDDDLIWMNRVHNAGQALQSVKNSLAAGFTNLTVDLIYGTPRLSDEQWRKNLDIIAELGIDHLSAYSLTVEPRTALAHFISTGKQPAVDEGSQALHFELLMDWAEQNRFEHYEISNFARNLKYSNHNSSYWRGEKYLGIGPSAHSYDTDKRQWNVRNNTAYIKSINEGIIPAEKEVLTAENKFNEYVLTSLRTMWGCNLEVIRKNFGEKSAEDFFRKAQTFIGQGMMLQQKQNFILTRSGRMYADKIAGELFREK